MSAASARLVILKGPQLHQEFEMTDPVMIIGREPTNAIAIGDPEVSRRHAEISRQGSATSAYYTVEDLGSTNGTFVNGRRTSGATPLQSGDLINLGDSVQMRFWQAKSEAAPAEPIAEIDTPPHYQPPPQPVVAAEPALPRYTTERPLVPEAPPGTQARAAWSLRRIIGCGCLALVLLFLCAALIFVLDAYEQGRLLYCGILRPFWEFILGPFGFNPVCL